MRPLPREFFVIVAALLVVGAEAAPRLELVGIVGDARGRGVNNTSLTVLDDGTVAVLTTARRVGLWAADGTYQRTLVIPNDPRQPYLAADGRRVLVGDFEDDAAWLRDPRCQGTAPGRFRDPADAVLADGRWYVADSGNQRLQVFAADLRTPPWVVELEGAPRVVAVRGDRVAVLVGDRDVVVFSADLREVARGRVAPDPRDLAWAPDGSLLASYSAHGHANCVRRYRDFVVVQELVPSIWAQDPEPFTADGVLNRAPDGRIWTSERQRGRLLSIDPQTATVREELRGLVWPSCVAVAEDGRLYVGQGAVRDRYDPFVTIHAAEPPYDVVGHLGAPDSLYESQGVPVYDLLPTADGGADVRVVVEGWQRGWPAFELFHVAPDGALRQVADFGSLYAVRRKFHPSAARHGLAWAADGNILLACLPYVAVVKMTPGGEVLWEAGATPRGGADAVDFVGPADLTVDAAGRIWVLDISASRIVCLSPAGKLLLKHGHFGTWDDRTGAAFAAPTGIAATADNHLYVADPDNFRLLHYRIAE